MSSIIAGVDGSSASTPVLAWAVRQAELEQAPLEVVVTWEWPNTAGAAIAYPEGYDPSQDAATMLAGLVDPLRAEHPSLTITSQIVEGGAGPALVKLSSGARLLVVGSRGHGEIAGLLLGSVSEYCATHADCPVVVVRGPRD